MKMKSLMKRFVAFALLLCMLLAAVPVGVSAEGTYTRVAGENRFETAFLTADKMKEVLGVEKFDTIIVASGLSFADALSGSYLATQKKAPILLVYDGYIDPVKDYISRNLAEEGTVYILGGTSAVSEAVEQALADFYVVRLAGANRYETNMAIVEEACGTGSEVIICTGRDFADSLSASAVGKAIILVDKKLTDAQKEMFSKLFYPSFYIIGGENAVSKSVEEELSNYGFTHRYGGTDRHQTSALVAAKFFRKPTEAVFAYSKNYPDGLCAGPLAYVMGAPLILTRTRYEKVADDFCADRHITQGTVLGGTGLISDGAMKKILDNKHNLKSDELFGTEDFITDVKRSIDTGTLVFDIDANVYVPGIFWDLSVSMADAMEKATGLKFNGGKYAMMYIDDKTHVQAKRSMLDNLPGSQLAEVYEAWASASGHAEVAPGDLFIVNDNYVNIHELGHVLMFRQTEWGYSRVLNEGFAEYTTYLALKELQKSDPAACFYMSHPDRCTQNMFITNYEKLYEHPIEYWFDNEISSEYAGNVNYTIGYRFMWYLDEVYGDYTKWVKKFEEMYPFDAEFQSSNDSEVNKQIEVLKAAYGDDVLDKFYPWLKKNQARFEPNWNQEVIDLTTVKAINWYPSFDAIESVMRIQRVKYKDLYINIDCARDYLEDYKKLDASNLTLKNPGYLKIELYKADGTLINTVNQNSISLKNVSYIKLVGSGQVNNLEVTGFLK